MLGFNKLCGLKCFCILRKLVTKEEQRRLTVWLNHFKPAATTLKKVASANSSAQGKLPRRAKARKAAPVKVSKVSSPLGSARCPLSLQS